MTRLIFRNGDEMKALAEKYPALKQVKFTVEWGAVGSSIAWCDVGEGIAKEMAAHRIPSLDRSPPWDRMTLSEYKTNEQPNRTPYL